jgi:hypothetical protein
MCGGKRRGRAALRQRLQDEVYEQTLPPGPFKKPRKAPEASFQIQVARYLAKALPEGWIFTAFPAGGGGRIRGARLKAMGLKAGFPDIAIFAPMGWNPYPTVAWLELKAKSGSLSQAQKDVHAQLKALGHQVATVKTLEQVQDALAEFCFPEKLRARVAC